MSQLNKYNQMRDFGETAEPQGKVKSSKGKLVFVVQKHWATRLHFDFRIELDGVLVSWAVPKGPPLKSAERHLAMMVEEHPFDYRDFEGVIPEGNYGAGAVMIWDQGTYEIPGFSDRTDIEKNLKKMIKDGSIKLILNGKKLKGQFALVRFKKAGDNAWLMIKDKDGHEGKELKNPDVSVKTGRTIDEIRLGLEANSSSNEEEPETPLPTEIFRPMLATLVDKPFDSKDWVFEIKWDGYRAIANVNKDVHLTSRNGQTLNSDYAPVVTELKKFKEQMVLDGEVVVVDNEGRSSFQLLQNYRSTQVGNLMYYVFDILEYKNKDLSNKTFLERRKILAKIFSKKFRHIKLSEYIEDQGEAFFKVAKEKGLEGIIAKRKDSIYEEGVRSDCWLKIKILNEQEVVIGGYTKPRGTRKSFGSLLIGVFKNGKFKYVGHTGSGFNDKDLASIKELLDKYKIKSSPFSNEVEEKNVAAWIKPKIIAEVKFAEWTDSGLMRHAIFVALRDDKSAKSIKKEMPEKVKEIVKNTKDAPDFVVKNQNKVYWPEDGLTKGDLLEYYDKISGIMLPYLKDRPQNLNRHPDGIHGQSFYQKDFNYPPEFARTEKIHSKSTGEYVDYLVCDNKETLLYMANLGCIEINPWNSRIGSLNYPDYLLFDLDAKSEYFKNIIFIANEIHKLLDFIGVESFPKTSGKRGIHIIVPTGTKYTFKQIRTLGEIIAVIIERKFPKIVNLERDPNKRKDKVYIDYLQNRKGQTTASVYSLRPVEKAPVSTPLKWEEVNNKLDPKKFNIKTIFKRLEKHDDLWKGIFKKSIDLQEVLARLETV